MELNFAGRRLHVTYHNPQRLDFGAYRIGSLLLNGEEFPISAGASLAACGLASLTLPRAAILGGAGEVVKIDVHLVEERL